MIQQERETVLLVRLVRACGSKQPETPEDILASGQARKSLWIETVKVSVLAVISVGQARKSLWIET